VGFANAISVTVGKVGNQPRREWRINANTGELRGIVWRTRNKERDVVRYVGKRKNPHDYALHKSVFDEWRRANRTLEAVGILVREKNENLY
jgi:hypothetical protein